MADLNDFYPPAPVSAGGAARAGKPASVSVSGTASAAVGGIGSEPTLWVLVFVGASLLFLHAG